MSGLGAVFGLSVYIDVPGASSRVGSAHYWGMSGRQGHNAVYGKQGFQPVVGSDPECDELVDPDSSPSLDGERLVAIENRVGVHADELSGPQASSALIALDRCNDTLNAAIVAVHDAGGPVAPNWRELDRDLVEARAMVEDAFVRFADAQSPGWSEQVRVAAQTCAAEAIARAEQVASRIDAVCEQIDKMPASRAADVVDSCDVRFAFASTWQLPPKTQMLRDARRHAEQLRCRAAEDAERFRSGLFVDEVASRLNEPVLSRVVRFYGSSAASAAFAAACTPTASFSHAG